MIAVLDDHRVAYGVEPLRKVRPTARSTQGAHAARRGDPARLAAPCRRRWQGACRHCRHPCGGVRKSWGRLGRAGITAARCAVARLMRSIADRARDEA